MSLNPCQKNGGGIDPKAKSPIGLLGSNEGLNSKAIELALSKCGLLTRLQRCQTLPSLPGVAERILGISEDPKANMSHVADVVSADAALTVKILRVANSAMYAQRNPVDSLRQALTLLGLQASLTLALSFSLISSIEADRKAGLNFSHFWRRSIASASVCRQLAIHQRIQRPESYFLAGLLQDIGMLALARVEPTLYANTWELQRDHAGICQHEKDKIGVDHAKVGAWLLQMWKFPPSMQSLLATSHDEEPQHNGKDLDQLQRAVAVASSVADAFYDQREDSDSMAVAQETAHRLLDVDRGALEKLFENLATEIVDLGEMLNLDLGDRSDVALLLDNARELLAIRSVGALRKAAEAEREMRELELSAEKLTAENRMDGLTGVYNRAHLDKLLDLEFSKTVAQDKPLTVVFIDLDHFKKINDSLGHQAGDDVLRQTAQCLLNVARQSDHVGRYGGDEFMAILPGCDSTAARAVCERYLQALQKLDTPSLICVSVGTATHNAAKKYESITEMVAHADAAAYVGKRAQPDSSSIYSAADTGGATATGPAA